MRDGLKHLGNPDNHNNHRPNPSDRVLGRVKVVQEQQDSKNDQNQRSCHALVPFKKRRMKRIPTRIRMAGQNLPTSRREMTLKLSRRKRLPASTRIIPPHNSMSPTWPIWSLSWSKGVMRL